MATWAHRPPVPAEAIPEAPPPEALGGRREAGKQWGRGEKQHLRGRVPCGQRRACALRVSSSIPHPGGCTRHHRQGDYQPNLCGANDLGAARTPASARGLSAQGASRGGQGPWDGQGRASLAPQGARGWPGHAANTGTGRESGFP